MLSSCSKTHISLLVIFFFISLHLCAHAGDLDQNVEINWGNDHAQMLNSGQLLTLSLDRTSGSGFQSKNEYLFGKFHMQLKLAPGNSAGTVTTYYLRSQGSTGWDEIDFEFLGNLSGDPYIVHTNIYTQGNGNREQQFYLWFDPTADFHNYSILWNPQFIIFYVDDIPIREYKDSMSIDIPFPTKQPMKIHGSHWNGEDWATRGGSVKTNWTEAPFTASYRDFSANACVWSSNASPCAVNSSDAKWMTQVLNPEELEKMKWVVKNYMIYNYCADSKRFPDRIPPECAVQSLSLRSD